MKSSAPACLGAWAIIIGGAIGSPAAAADQAAPAAQPDSGAANTVGDIVVTAQRRSERLQNVPIAVAAINGTQLAAKGINNVLDLGKAVPTLSVSNEVGFTVTSLRGIGSTAIGPSLENPVSIYVDGVYYASTSSLAFDLVNIERVEVLKGPQGTLFGRNATAGLIQVITRDPDQSTMVSGHLSYGNYQTVRGDLYLSGPITDTLAADLSMQGSAMGKGYGKNLYNGKDISQNLHNFTVRSKWVWTPLDGTKATLIADYGDQRNSMNGPSLSPGTIPNPLTGGAIKTGNPRDIDENVQPLLANRNGGASLKIEQDLGFATLSNLAAYRRAKTRNRFDVDYTPAPYLNADLYIDEKQFSDEVQLASNGGGRFKWQAGLFYFDGHGAYEPSGVDFGFGADAAHNPVYPLEYLSTFANQHTTSVAGYGQATWEFLPATNLTGGARYTYEKRTIVGRTDAALVGNVSIGTIATENDRISFRKPTFRIALDHRFSPEVMIYASFNTGFRSGGFNTQNLGDPAFQPETLKAYEAGIKTDLFDRRLRLNLDGFYYDYKNIQVQKVGLSTTGIINGAGAHDYGIEADFEALITPAFRISGSAAAIHARFTDFANAPLSIPAGGVPVTIGSAKDNQLPKAPGFQGMLAGDYRIELPRGRIDLNANLSYNSGYYLEADNIQRQRAFTQLGASATWTAPGDRFSVKVWGVNLTDKLVEGYGGTLSDGTHSFFYEPPRTYGVTFGFNFK
jgi:outer membrane receptor protein involved in Fe transport